MRGRARALTALALSLAIYAVPVVSAHWFNLFGPALVAELRSDRPMPWIAADWALALVAQAALGVLAWIALGWRPPVTVAVLILACLPAVYAVNAAYMAGIPAFFLIEADHTPDTGDLPVACALRDVWLVPAPAGVTRAIDARGEALVGTGDGRYGILRIPQCAVEPVAVPQLPIAPSIQQITDDGSVLYLVYERGGPAQTFWLLRRGAAQPVQVVPPADISTSYPFPLISNDAEWVAWTIRAPGSPLSIRLLPLGGGAPRVVEHDLLQRATVTPVELDPATGLMIVNRDLTTFVALSLDGGVSWGPVTAPGVAVQPSTFRYAGGQWLAWDAYVEGRAKVARWSSRNGSGSHTVPLGRSFTAGALSSDGHYVAFSTTTELNIGSISDTVLVKRTSDGKEVFRKTLPPYARSHVVFLGNRHFAYTDIATATDKVTATTRVLRLPD